MTRGRHTRRRIKRAYQIRSAASTECPRRNNDGRDSGLSHVAQHQRRRAPKDGPAGRFKAADFYGAQAYTSLPPPAHRAFTVIPRWLVVILPISSQRFTQAALGSED